MLVVFVIAARGFVPVLVYVSHTALKLVGAGFAAAPRQVPLCGAFT